MEHVETKPQITTKRDVIANIGLFLKSESLDFNYGLMKALEVRQLLSILNEPLPKRLVKTVTGR